MKNTLHGHLSLDNVLINFMFRRRFNANAETTAMVNAFNEYLTVLEHEYTFSGFKILFILNVFIFLLLFSEDKYYFF